MVKQFYFLLAFVPSFALAQTDPDTEPAPVPGGSATSTSRAASPSENPGSNSVVDGIEVRLGEREDAEEAGGFSLIEVLVSVVVLSVAALGVTSVWRLADNETLTARLGDRAARILKEYYELQTFAPDYLFGRSRLSPAADPDSQGIPLQPGDRRSGFLYHPRRSDLSGNSGRLIFGDEIPYQINLVADAQGQVLTLTYRPPTPNGAELTVTRQIRLNPRQQ